ncbi:MAG: winged helix-turn-helix transcriptional regulator [Mitsuokella sp.]
MGSRRQMEADGIIMRTTYPEVLPRIGYALSKLGIAAACR